MNTKSKARNVDNEVREKVEHQVIKIMTSSEPLAQSYICQAIGKPNILINQQKFDDDWRAGI